MSRSIFRAAIATLVAVVVIPAAVRPLEIETTQITRPDVAVAANGDFLVFTALDHLLSLLTVGGKARQVTFGPWFDSDPAISPDGRTVVFASDRNGESNGNLFLLDLASGDLRQLTQERWAARPVFSPDGADNKVTSFPGTIRLPEESIIDIKNRSFSIVAEVETLDRKAEGLLVTTGADTGGYAPAVQDGKPAFYLNCFSADLTSLNHLPRRPPCILKASRSYSFL